MDEIILKVQKNFESIKKMSGELEFWSARDLMPMLGYAKWQKFIEAIGRAKEACRSSSQKVEDHFTGAGKPIVGGKGAVQMAQDILLTRYACYLVAQNGDPRKTEIALAQTYFATQTRKQEILVQREKEDKRLEARAKLKDTENKIESTVYHRGIQLPVEFAVFKNKHIETLYGGIISAELKNKKGIPLKRSLTDFDTQVELRAKDFALAMTDHNIKEKNLNGSYQMTEEVVKNSRATRKTLLERGIRPENLKAQEDLKKIQTRRKKELRLVEGRKAVKK